MTSEHLALGFVAAALVAHVASLWLQHRSAREPAAGDEPVDWQQLSGSITAAFVVLGAACYLLA